MSNHESMKLTVSRIIPARKWRVMRLITRVWDFPDYVPNVKAVSVVEKHGNTMKTRWQVQVEKIPISWVEEDRLVFSKDRIYFKAAEGDLREFQGEWIFKDHPEGTLVTVNISLEVGIPAIREFADAYVKKLVARNFEAILESAERRLISTRYQSYKSGNTEKIAGFGIIGHLYNFCHLERCLKMINPDFRMPSREFIGQLFHITPSFKLYDILDFKSRTGQATNGCFIVATFIPDMVEKDMWAIFSKVVKACKIAEKNGVGVVTLGGFTSIVAERIGHEIANEVDVPVTTGNTFTAVMAVDGTLKAGQLLKMDIANARAAIIGGTGDIGSACARALVDKVRQVTITGRTKSNLKRTGTELSKKRKAKIIATTDNEAAVRDADIVIAAASSAQSILKVEWCKPGAVIFDVGYPKNISYAPITRNDILVFSGGLTKSPTPVNLPIDIGLPSPDTIYGCFAEAVILALEKRYENFSFGRGNITIEKMAEIRDLGKKHGFEVADFYWGDKLVDESMVGRIKEVVPK